MVLNGAFLQTAQAKKVRATLDFREFKVGLNPSYRIF